MGIDLEKIPKSYLNDIVISFNGSLQAPVEDYCEKTDRDLICVENKEELLAFHQKKPGKSLLIIGERTRFPASVLNFLLENIASNWSFLPLSGPADLAHYYQKSQGLGSSEGSDSSSRVGYIDAIYKIEDLNLHQKQGAKEYLTGSSDQVAVLHSHGDGAHLKLGGLILCGLVGPHESSDKNPTPKDGLCHLDGKGNVVCKRTQNKAHQQSEILRFGDISVPNLVLLTCNGISAAGDVYPSNSSLVLSALAGKPLNILSTNRRVPFKKDLIDQVVNMSGRGEDLYAIASMLNSFYQREYGEKAFLIFGDPMTKALPPSQDARLTGQKGHDDSDLPPNKSESTIDQILNTLKYLEARVAENTILISNIQNHLPPERPDEQSEIGKTVLSLIQINSILSQLNNLGIRSQNESKLNLNGNRTWHAAWLAKTQAILAMFDSALAKIMDWKLLDGEAEKVLTNHVIDWKLTSGANCERCGTKTTVKEGASPMGMAAYTMEDCPTCGPRAAWNKNAGPISCSLPNPRLAFQGGEVFSLELNFDSFPSTSIDLNSKAVVLIQLRDTARGLVSVRKTEEVDLNVTDTLKLDIPTPKESALEMHTLRILALHNGICNYLRYRLESI